MTLSAITRIFRGPFLVTVIDLDKNDYLCKRVTQFL